jgi:hypothetical protein
MIAQHAAVHVNECITPVQAEQEQLLAVYSSHSF